jgi:hypothetical protein
MLCLRVRGPVERVARPASLRRGQRRALNTVSPPAPLTELASLVMPLTGEQTQLLGEQGAQRAKRWLESTCRAEVKWNNPTLGVNKLQHLKAGAPAGSTAQGDSFSFDMGGTLLGGALEGDLFVAESKKYATPGDQGTEYRKFVAKCYRLEDTHAQVFDHFMWITWSPFLVTSWDELLTPTFIQAAVTGTAYCKYVALGTGGFDAGIGGRVAGKLLIVVLADGQEVALSLHGDELLHVRKALLELRASS